MSVKMIRVILVRLFCWIFPVFLFDGCLNRDPHLRVDEHFTIGASWPGAPMYLDYWNKSEKWSAESAEGMSREEWEKAFQDYQTKQHWQLSEITDYGLSENVILGNSPKGWFIADRDSGELKLFSSSNERDRVLREGYHLDPLHSFTLPSMVMWMKSNWLWPWVHLYYAACFVFIPWLTVAGRKRAA